MCERTTPLHKSRSSRLVVGMIPSLVNTNGFHAGSIKGQGIVLLEEQNLYAYSQDVQGDRESEIARPLDIKFPFHDDSAIVKTDNPMDLRVDASSRNDLQTPFQLQMTPYATSSHATIPSSRGAIRPGGAVNLLGRQHIGLLVNWALIGFFDGSVAGLARPFLSNYLGYNDSQLNAAVAIFNTPRLFKSVGGFISDSFPINRRRRKTYMFIGWVVLLVFMGVLAMMDEPTPMKRGGIVVNAHANNQGPRYVLLILIGMFGALMFTAVACEGMMVEYSHREGLFDRGRTTCWCIGTRFLCEGIGSMTTALAFNSNEFGGTFHSAVPLRLIFAGYALLGLVGVVFTKFFIYEEQTPVTSQRLATQCRRIWSILQKRMVSQVTVLGFLINVGFLYKIYEADQINKAWHHMNQLEANIPVALVSEGKAAAAAFIFFFLLNANWRSILVIVKP